MKRTRPGLLILTTSVAAGGILVLLSLSGCDGELCCPEITSFRTSPGSWVCPGETSRLSYEFQCRRDGKLCEPPDVILMHMRNITDDEAVPAEEIQARRVSKGIYVNKEPIAVTLDHSARYEFRVTGECGLVTTSTLVPVLDEDGDRAIFGYQVGVGPYVPTGWGPILLSSIPLESRRLPGAHRGPGPWMEIPVDIFGDQVTVDAIENPHPFDIEVKFRGVTATLPADGTSTAHKGLRANGTWALRVEEELYDQLLEGHELVMIIPHLNCLR